MGKSSKAKGFEKPSEYLAKEYVSLRINSLSKKRVTEVIEKLDEKFISKEQVLKIIDEWWDKHFFRRLLNYSKKELKESIKCQ